MIGHAESVWIETERPLDAAEARELLAGAPSIRLEEVPTPGKSAGIDEVLVGRIRNDRAGSGITLHFASDNLRKGAALNAVQIAETLAARNLFAGSH
jgi:aspartate-semialdehyde dehydrogenase